MPGHADSPLAGLCDVEASMAADAAVALVSLSETGEDGPASRTRWAASSRGKAEPLALLCKREDEREGL